MWQLTNTSDHWTWCWSFDKSTRSPSHLSLRHNTHRPLAAQKSSERDRTELREYETARKRERLGETGWCRCPFLLIRDPDDVLLETEKWKEPLLHTRKRTRHSVSWVRERWRRRERMKERGLIIRLNMNQRKINEKM